MRRLLERAPDFNFFQALRILESLFPGSSRLGTGDDMTREGFRIETLNSLAFPAADVAAVLPPKRFLDQREDLERAQGKEFNLERASADLNLPNLVRESKSPVRVLVTFMGLYGVSSPLPSYFIDPITLRRLDYFELKKFLDFFNHRLYSLFYRAWKKYRHPTHFNPRFPDDTSLRLLAMTGQWPRRPKGENASATFDFARIPYARYLGNRVRSAKGLEQLLRGYFAFPKVRVLAFASAWYDIPMPTRLGNPGVTLGGGTRLGERMEDRVSSFRVEIGPLPEPRYLEIQESLWGAGQAPPNPTPLWKRIRDLIEAYLRDPLFFEVRVVLAPDATLPPNLGSGSARLGGFGWLGETARETVALRF